MTVKRNPKGGRPSLATPDFLRQVLAKLVVRPRLTEVAGQLGVNPDTLFGYLKRSREGDEVFQTLEWYGTEQPFHVHYDLARKLSIVAMDASARDQAINGWEELKFDPKGNPVWKVDPELAADALDPKRWQLLYGERPMSDVYVKQDGRLVQEKIFHPPNAQLLVKMLSSLAPDVYGERQDINVNVSGGVWVGGEPLKQIAQRTDMNATFGLTPNAQLQKRSLNTLAVPRQLPPEEFAKKYDRKLVREVVIFRDVNGKPERPLNDDVIVENSRQHKIFKAANIECVTTSAQQLIGEGYTNDFLFEIARYGEEQTHITDGADNEQAA